MERKFPAPELIFPGRQKLESGQMPEVIREEKDLVEFVSNATSLDELCAVLANVSEIPGSSLQRDERTGSVTPLSGAACVRRIQRFASGKGSLGSITRGCGIREAVRRLSQ